MIGPMVSPPINGDIILGNSATEANNHLDVLEVVQKYKQTGQKIIMPLSYGNERYRSWLRPQIQNSEVQPLYDFMPRKEYFQLIAKCSYAVFGIIRQQAMGNVNFAISKGIKVFLYKDSIVYQNLKELGFVVYTIEDMNEDSFRTPLTPLEIEQNNFARIAEYNRRLGIYNQFIQDVTHKRE